MIDQTDNEQQEVRIHNPHDAAFKSAFQKKEIAESFFKKFLPEAFNRHIEYESLKIENKSYVDENFKEKHSDIVYRAKIKGKTGFLYILFEHQSSADYWMIFRLLCYMINLWKSYLDQHPKAKHLPIIIPMVLYNGESRWSVPREFSELFSGREDFSEIIPNFSYLLLDLTTYDDEKLKAFTEDLALSVILYLMKHIFSDDVESVFKNLTDLFIRLKSNPNLITLLEWALQYAYHARNENDEQLNKIIEKQIERLDESKVKEVFMTAAEQIERKGFQKGLSEGIQKGIEEGKLKGLEEGKQMLLLKLLQKRFDNIPKNLKNKIESAKINMLEACGESIFEFKSIKDVEKWWNENN